LDTIPEGRCLIGRNKGAIEIMEKKRNPMFFAIGIGFAAIYLYSDTKKWFFKSVEKVKVVLSGPLFDF